MKKLEFYYYLRFDFEHDVTGHQYVFRFIPHDTNRQKILDYQMELRPEGTFFLDKDGFGNTILSGSEMQSHNSMELSIRGTAVAGLAREEQYCEDYKIGMFYPQTKYTRPGEEIKKFFAQIPLTEAMSNLEKSRMMMHSLYECIQYVTASTNIYTTAEMAFSQGKGVCQDYAHIMLSLCRMEGIACRYVVGMMIGEGESHAWVEIEQEGAFYGFDPTNDLEIDENYVKISHGRDYEDCLMNCGVFCGGGFQKQTTRVAVTEVS